MGSGCNICSHVSPAGYLLLSVVSAKAASMMPVRKGSGETIYECVVRQLTTNCEAYVFTTSAVPATGPRGSKGNSSAPLSDSLFLRYRSPIEIALKGHGGIFCATEPRRSFPRSRAAVCAIEAQRG